MHLENIGKLAFAALLLLSTACGRTDSGDRLCFGNACPCVYDTDCPEFSVCWDAVCVREIDAERCIDLGISPETCNGFDDDCNGVVDDGLPDRSCTQSADGLVCTGVERCGGAVGWVCDARVPREEQCDQLDDDCDGEVDEDFVDAEGVYTSLEHCGGCNVACADLIPEAARLECQVLSGAARCVALACEGSLVPSEDGSRCITLLEPLCRACASDADCVGEVNRCLELAEGERACGRSCAPGSVYGTSCPTGFSCLDEQCVPDSGTCRCGQDSAGAQRSCVVEPSCEGLQTCEATGGSFGWSSCDISAATETCDGLDNDCDGEVDDGFVDASGRYVSDEHCGVCNNDCTRQWVESVDHAVGACDASGADPTCAIARCTTEVVGGQSFEWVDVDGLADTGCECRRRAGNLTVDAPDLPGMPGTSFLATDENCDGIDGVIADSIFVSASAAAGGDGSRARPFTTITAGLAASRADASKTAVLVAAGTYLESVELRNGDVLHGGYATDFGTREPTRLESVIRSPEVSQASLRANSVGLGNAAAVVAGFHVRAPDVVSTPAEGAAGITVTAVELLDCGPGLRIVGSTFEGGRAGAGGPGAPGIRGFGRQSSTDLDGTGGRDGERRPGTCPAGSARSGGAGGVNSSCNLQGRVGGGTDCPVFDDTVTPVRGTQVPHVSPTSGGDGAGGFHWTFDRLSESTCSHLTESGFPSDIQDNNGQDGQDGSDGARGEDARGCTAWFGDVASGAWAAVDARDGVSGRAGQAGGGGGGGGGTKRFFRNANDCASHELGSTGGGGGAPGCGGAGGAGGRGGGASLVVVVRGSAGALPTLADNLIVRGRGGAGGAGGFGGTGGEGGRGGSGGQPTSWSGSEGGSGGDGGNGGVGGTGGGGCGGPALGIWVLGAEAPASYASGNDFAASATADLGGAGGAGAGGAAGSDGADGGSRQILGTPSCGAGGACGAGFSCGSGGFCLPTP